MTTSTLTAQGRAFADPPNIVEIVPDKRWRVSLQVVSWEGELESSNISRVVYWWPRSLSLALWPTPVLDPTLGPISSGQAGNGYTKPPGNDTLTSADPRDGSGSTILTAQDSPADGFFPALVRIGLSNADDGDPFTWYHLSPFTARSILGTGGAPADIESQFRVQVRLGVKPAGIDGGGP